MKILEQDMLCRENKREMLIITERANRSLHNIMTLSLPAPTLPPKTLFVNGLSITGFVDSIIIISS